MTQGNDNSPPELMIESSAKKTNSRRAWPLALVAIILFVAIGLAGVYFGPLIVSDSGNQGQNISRLDGEVRDIEKQVQTLDTRVDDLNARLEKSAATASSVPEAKNETPAAAPVTETGDIARMKSDLVALSMALASLQTEIKETAGTVSQKQQATQASIAAFIAFTQLRTAVVAGKPFASEAQTLRSAAADDKIIQAQLSAIDPYATQGAPTLAVLREHFAAQIPSVEVAIAKAKAANWWQRILAEIKGVVSVRSLHGGDKTPDDILTTIESDLDRGDLAEAFDHYDKLPPEAQKILEDWHKDAEARQKIDDALRLMADHFVSQAQGTP